MPQYQVINVPHVGPIQVPDDMPDDQVSASIRKNFPAAFPRPVSQLPHLNLSTPAPQAAAPTSVPVKRTPEQLAERMTYNGQDLHEKPLSPMLQGIHDFAQKHLLTPYLGPAIDEAASYGKYFQGAWGGEGRPTPLPTTETESHLGTKDIPEALAEHPQDSKVLAGLRAAGQGIYGAVEGLTTPAMLAASLGFKYAPNSIPAKAAGAGWSAQMLKQVPGEAEESYKKLKTGDVYGGVSNLTQGTLNLAMGVLGATSVLHDTSAPVTETKAPTPGIPEAGRATYNQPTYTPPAYKAPEYIPPTHVSGESDAPTSVRARRTTKAVTTPSAAKPAEVTPASTAIPTSSPIPLVNAPVTPQAINPSSPSKAETLEGPIRDLVGSVTKMKQLAQSATARLHVMQALNQASASEVNLTSATKPLAEEEVAKGKTNQSPIVNDVPYKQLGKDEQTRVKVVASVLGTTAKQLENNHYRLSDEQAAALKASVKAGVKPVALPDEHPEKAFGDQGIHQLAAINQKNAELAGVKNSHSLWGQLSDKDKQAHAEFVGSTSTAVRGRDNLTPEERMIRQGAINTIAKAAGIDPMEFINNDLKPTPSQQAKIRAAAKANPEILKAAQSLVDTQAKQQAPGIEEARLTAGGQGEVSVGSKDNATLQHNHDMLQKVLGANLKKAQTKLNTLVPAWRQARISETEPSKLSQDIEKLPATYSSVIPKELYAEEHTRPKGQPSPESPVVQKPVQATPAPASISGGETTDVRQKSEGGNTTPVERVSAQAVQFNPVAKSYSPAKAVTEVKAMSDDILQRHGQDAANGLSVLDDAIRAKYKVADNINQVLHATISKYQEYLDNGKHAPLQEALKFVEGLKAEKPGQTFYANPLGPIWNAIFGSRQTPVVRAPLNPGPLSLNESPIHTLTDELINRGSAPVGERFSAFFANEAARIADTVNTLSKANAQVAINEVKGLVNKAWQAYKTRPGLNPLEMAFGLRRLQLSSNAIMMHEFHDQIQKNHPRMDRREAMINYLQASGGVLPDRDVNAQLQLKANSFAATSSENAKLKKGYINAQNLTPEEKATVENYRQYDTYLRQQEVAAGVELHERENYIRQIWSKGSLARKGIDAMFNSASFAVNPNFAKMRKFDDYFEGEQAGLVPKRKDFAYLVEARARASSEVLANRALVQHLYNNTMPNGEKLATVGGVGYAVPSPNPNEVDRAGAILVKKAIPSAAMTEDGRPYVTFDHSAFRNWKWVGTVGTDGFNPVSGEKWSDVPVLYKGDMLVHPDIAAQLKTILGPSALRQGPVGRGLLGLSSIGKQSLLIGLFHPVQLGIHFLEHAAEGSTTSRTMKALNPWNSSRIIDLDHDLDQQMLVMHGLKVADFSTDSLWDDGVMSRGFTNAAPGIGPILANLHDAMFQKYIPNLKMGMALDALDRNMGRYHDKYRNQIQAENPGIAIDKASKVAQGRVYRMTAEQMNAAFGGLNWEALPVNKTMQDVARLAVLAPDFLLARMQFVGDALRPGGMESRKALAIGAFVQFAAARAFNAAMNDGDAKYDIHDWNKFVAGKHEYSLRTVQGDMMDSILNTRQFAEHRMNPLMIRPLAELETGKDVFGHPASAGQQLYDAMKNIVPMPLQGTADWAAHKLDINLRSSKNNEQVADSFVSSMTGVHRGTYRTPAERKAFGYFDEVPKSETTDELSLEQKNTFLDLRDRYRKGKLTDDALEAAVNKGTLKESEVKYLFKTKNETELQTITRQLPVTQAFNVWDKASPQEKVALAPIILHKVKDLPPDKQDAASTKISDYINSLAPDEQDKIEEKLQLQIEEENPEPIAPEGE